MLLHCSIDLLAIASQNCPLDRAFCNVPSFIGEFIAAFASFHNSHRLCKVTGRNVKQVDC